MPSDCRLTAMMPGRRRRGGGCRLVVGYKLGGMIALFLADYLETSGVENYWQMTFVMLGVLVVLYVGAVQFPRRAPKSAPKVSGTRSSRWQTVWAERAVLFVDQFRRPGDRALWSFFRKNMSRSGDDSGLHLPVQDRRGLHGQDVDCVHKEVGFEMDIAIYSKHWLITTVVFTLIGGLFALRTGVVRALLISGIAMAATNILFSVLHWVGQNELMFAIAVIADDLLRPLPLSPSSPSSVACGSQLYGHAICASGLDRDVGTNASGVVIRCHGRLAEYMGNLLHHHRGGDPVPGALGASRAAVPQQG